jgi:hypothetical protein
VCRVINQLQKQMKITPEKITEIRPWEVLVFGLGVSDNSNCLSTKYPAELSSIAVFGEGFCNKGSNVQRNYYALPVKGESISLTEIKASVRLLRSVIESIPSKLFLITPIGIDAGFSASDIAPMFDDFVDIPNATIPMEFLVELPWGRNKGLVNNY